MSEKTKIQWCDSTVNLWSGCTKVDLDCKNCYAETLSARGMTVGKGEDARKTLGEWGKDKPRQLHESAFELAVKLNKKPWICDVCGVSVATPLDSATGHIGSECFNHNIKYHRRRIFSLSLGDWLDDEVPVEWLARMLKTVFECSDVTWILLTKRPELFRVRLEQVASWCNGQKVSEVWRFLAWICDWVNGNPPRGIWILTSVGHQKAVDERVPELLKIPAVVHGLSVEPLTESVSLEPWISRPHNHTFANPKPELPGFPNIDWVIVGGESGKRARPCNVEWIRSVVQQCKAVGTACFVKQLGADPVFKVPPGLTREEYQKELGPNAGLINDKKGGDTSEWPADLVVQQFPTIRPVHNLPNPIRKEHLENPTPE